MMRVLLTGAGGFLGSHILENILRDTDWDVVCIDSFQHNGVTDRISSIVSSTRATDVVVHDLTAPFSLRQIARIYPVDAIIHAASRCSVDESIQYPVEYITNNIASTVNMLELARQVRSCYYIHISTDEVYGSHNGLNLPNNHQPSSPYAASKAAQEDISLAYRRTYDIPLTIVNSSNIFGERQSHLAFIPKVVRAVLNDESIEIHMRAKKPGERYYTYAPNIAAFLVTAIDNQLSYEEDNYFAERLPLQGQQLINNQDLAERIAKILDRKLKSKAVLAEDIRPGYDASYVNLLSNALWRPRISFDEGLENTVLWFADHREWLDL